MNSYVSVVICFFAFVFTCARLTSVSRFNFDAAMACAACGVVGAGAAYLVCNIAGLVP